MMKRLLERRRVQAGDPEAGIAMILVIGFMVIAMGLMVVASGIAINSLRSSRHHITFEQALDVAEQGVDQFLARLQQNNTYAYCGNTTCTSGDNFASSCFLSANAERDCARTKILSWIASNRLPLSQGNQGQYAAIRVPNRQAIYSMGFTPNYTATDKKVRLLKGEYLFAPFAPAKALLTGANLDIGGSVFVDQTGAGPADVHSNANVTGPASLTVEGSVTSSGTFNVNPSANISGVHQGGEPLQGIPTIDPRFIYNTQVATYGGNYLTATGAGDYTGQWYDLCPDGTARIPVVGTPCTGIVLDSSAPFRAWHYDNNDGVDNAPLWTADIHTGAAPGYAGVYYGYRVSLDAKMGGQDKDRPWTTTLLAEPDPARAGYANASRCNRWAGDIAWNHAEINNLIPGLVILAGNNITGGANERAGNGLFAAWGKINLSTSSATITGAVIAANNCPGAGGNEVQGITLKYDGNTEAPIQSLIRTTQWIEYVG